jgi:hypothetical protein
MEKPMPDAALAARKVAPAILHLREFLRLPAVLRRSASRLAIVAVA